MEATRNPGSVRSATLDWMGSLTILRPDQRDEWLALTARAYRHDFHHLPFFHALAEEAGEGDAHLFAWEDGDAFVALPLVLRPLAGVECQAGRDHGWQHATCVYGYAGPFVSSPELPDAVLAGFRGALTEALTGLRVASVFSRLHPLLPQREVVAGLGEVVPHGQTVSIDLTLPVDVQRTHFRSTHKRHLNRLAREGATTVVDHEGAYLDAFTEVYDESMDRLGAAGWYYFGREHFGRFFDRGEVESVFVPVLIGGEVAACGLFTRCGPIVQAHLNGTRSRHWTLSPAKMMYDAARLWATEVGAEFLHIGGGVGGGEDPLFQFKAGFSRQRHDFLLWRWVLQPEVTVRLTESKHAWRLDHGRDPDTGGYFPPYLCPDCPCGS